MQSTTSNHDLTIRMLNEGDEPALSHLAQRDSAAIPVGELLGAELDGALIAAVTVSHPDRRALADPFVATEQAVTLLDLRARQLRDESHSASRRRHRPRRPRIARARGAIAGSPPGGGSRLLQL